jgi:hypothetical protein
VVEESLRPALAQKDLAQRPVADLSATAELAAGHHLDEGGVAGLSADDWLRLWRAFRQRYLKGGNLLASGAASARR